VIQYEKSPSYIREYAANDRRGGKNWKKIDDGVYPYLTTHEDGRELDNVRFDVHVGDGLRGLEAKEPAADDGGALDVVILDVREHVLEIFDRLSLNVGMEVCRCDVRHDIQIMQNMEKRGAKEERPLTL